MSNYDNVRGADVSLWEGDSTSPEWEDSAALVEEMYFENDSGQLVARVDTDYGLIDLSIPVKAAESWNEFADSLPRWSV